jgi:hypothetical protein
MEKYEVLDMEVIFFQNEDVITASGDDWGGPLT